MKSLFALVLAALLPGKLTAESAPTTETIAPILAMGAYVPTDDMQGSKRFYRALFDKAPMIELPGFIAFDVAGGWFAVVSRETYAPGAQPGSGAVPYLQSADLDAVQARLTSIGNKGGEIITEPGIQLLKITDPNGQLIEFFKLTGQ
jgi:predicted enzyme related to lactoylglutathione lyase